jgi:hypothetical protein
MQEVNNDEEVRIRGPLVCFHQYGENDDVGNIFVTINEFKKGKKIKYTHFPQKRVIYFSVPSNDVSEFSKIIRFSKSKSNFKSSYNCGNNKEEFEKLNNQMDSFIKIKGITKDDGTFEILFKSNLPHNLHIRASKRIFEAADVQFNRDKSISASRPYRYEEDDKDDNDDKDENIKQTKQTKQTTKSFDKNKHKNNNNKNNKSVDVDENIESDEQQQYEKHQEDEQIDEEHIEEEEEERVEEPIVIIPKKRGRKPAAQITRKA